MELIPLEFEDRTFRYTQVQRQDMVAIYQQTHKESGAVRYEVVKLRIDPPHTWPNGTTSLERESYPGAGQWGQRGWTTHTRQAADALFATLCAGQEQAC
jgi:hypothetical protein